MLDSVYHAALRFVTNMLILNVAGDHVELMLNCQLSFSVICCLFFNVYFMWNYMLLSWSGLPSKRDTESLVDESLHSILTLRVGGAGDHLLGAQDRGLAVVGEDSDASLQHPHGGKGVAAAT